MDEPWYSVRCLFVHEHQPSKAVPPRAYEERIILVRAAGFEDAIARAQMEARRYAAEIGGVRFLEAFADAYHVCAQELASGTEVFSRLRHGDLEPDQFVAEFSRGFLHDDG